MVGLGLEDPMVLKVGAWYGIGRLVIQEGVARWRNVRGEKERACYTKWTTRELCGMCVQPLLFLLTVLKLLVALTPPHEHTVGC